MPISEYIQSLRRHIGTDLIFMPAVMAIVFNGRGEVLLGLDPNTNNWHVIGGALDPHEEPAACAVREVKEETGIDVRVDRLVGVYNGPFIKYANGDQVQYLTISILCRTIDDGQAPRVVDEELIDVRFWPIDQLPEGMDEWIKAKIRRAASGGMEGELVRVAPVGQSRE